MAKSIRPASAGRLQPPVLAFPHHPLHVLLRDFQILEQHAFELVGAIWVLGHLPEPVQSQGHDICLDRSKWDPSASHPTRTPHGNGGHNPRALVAACDGMA